MDLLDCLFLQFSGELKSRDGDCQSYLGQAYSELEEILEDYSFLFGWPLPLVISFRRLLLM